MNACLCARLCVSLCTYVRVHACVCMRMHACVFMRMHVYACIRTCIHLYASLSLRIHRCACADLYVWVYAWVCGYVRTWVCGYVGAWVCGCVGMCGIWSVGWSEGTAHHGPVPDARELLRVGAGHQAETSGSRRQWGLASSEGVRDWALFNERVWVVAGPRFRQVRDGCSDIYQG